MKSKMHDFALPNDPAETGRGGSSGAAWLAARASRNLGSERPSSPRPPALITSRRDIDSARCKFRQPLPIMRPSQQVPDQTRPRAASLP